MMESRGPNGTEGAGELSGWSSSPMSLLGTLHDENQDSLDNLVLNNAQSPMVPLVLSLEQIRSTRRSNKYTAGPTVPHGSPNSHPQKSELLPRLKTTRHQGTLEERSNNLRNVVPSTHYGDSNLSICSGDVFLPPPATDNFQDNFRTTVGCALGRSTASEEQIIRTQPKHAQLISEELKPAIEDSMMMMGPTFGKGGGQPLSKHSKRCAVCSRCLCADCSRPRALPSCWTCGRRCVCSAQNAVEYGTCVCCIKGLLYHCSSDDEDMCSDKPFSCTQSHCYLRWTAVSLISLLFPCILCYLPAKRCIATCQSCYDRVTRPGCRCQDAKRIHC